MKTSLIPLEQSYLIYILANELITTSCEDFDNRKGDAEEKALVTSCVLLSQSSM